MNTILSYYGGKQKIASWILSYFPDDYKKLHYVEPFAGGLALLFRKEPSDRETINDIDKNVYTFWKVLTDEKQGPELVDKLKKILYIEDLYKESIEKLKCNFISELERAYSYYVALQMSYSNKITGGFGYSKDLYKKDSLIFYNKTKRLDEFRERFKNVQVLNKDALEVIQKMDSKKTFFYIDPPYINTYQGDYAGI